MRISFGPFAFDRQSRLLWRDGAEIALPPRVLGVLELLIDRAGEVVARQDLLNGVWKDAFVTDTSLAEAVSFLRQALGDDPQAPQYIQTVHRRGYRFLAPVLEQPTASPVAPTPVVEPRPKASIGWQLLPWSMAILSAGLVAGAIWRTTADPDADLPQIARFNVQPAAGTSFDRQAPSLAVSPDGRSVAWAACEDSSGACAIYVRAIDRLDSTRLVGTDGGSSPFFSPDGRWIAFFADGKLKKIAATGGSPLVIADAPAPGGGSWDPGGRIAFAGTPAGGLSVVSDEGGEVTVVTTPRIDRGELRHMHPAWLSRGGLLFVVARSPLENAAGDLAAIGAVSRDWNTLRPGVTRALPAGPGYVVLSTGSDLQATRFDERAPSLVGGADSVLASVGGGDPLADFAFGGGTLAAIRSTKPGRIGWTDSTDAILALPPRLTSIVVSPDSRRLAGVLSDTNGSDIWLVELASGAASRITYSGTNVSPAWSVDGSRLFFATRTTGAFAIGSRDLARSDQSPPVAQAGAHLFPSSTAPDGRLAVTIASSNGRTSIGIIPAAGGRLQVLNDGPFDEAAAAFSPDGQWLALESDETGRTEIVARHMGDGRRVAVSGDGGRRPRWSADGRALYFEAGRALVRVGFDGTTTRSVTDRKIVFDRAGSRVLAVSPSGRLLIRERDAGPEAGIVVLQWLRELTQHLPLPVTAPR